MKGIPSKEILGNKVANLRISWSGFVEYDKCPFVFCKAYVLGEKYPSHPSALLGCGIHELFKKVYSEQKFIPKYIYGQWKGVLKKEYETSWKSEQYGLISKEKVTALEGQGFGLIKRYIELAEKNALFRPALFTELALLGKYRNHKLKVKLDIGFKFPWGICIADFKTGKLKDIDIMQLCLYSVLYEKRIGEKVAKLLPLYFNEKVTYYDRTEGLLKDTGRYIAKAYEGILKLDFTPKENQYCSTCYFREECGLF